MLLCRKLIAVLLALGLTVSALPGAAQAQYYYDSHHHRHHRPPPRHHHHYDDHGQDLRR